MREREREERGRITGQPIIAARGTAITGATGTATLNGLIAGNTITVAGQVFTAVASSATPTTIQFVAGATDAASATNLAAALNAHATVKSAVTATAAGAVVSLTAKPVGVAGNYLALVTNATTVTLTGAALSGGVGTGRPRSPSAARTTRTRTATARSTPTKTGPWSSIAAPRTSSRR